MYGEINQFSFTKFLDKTYPTKDDTEAKQEVIDYIAVSLSDNKNVKRKEMDHFMETFIVRVRAISNLCNDCSDMDKCPVEVVGDIANSIDKDLKFILRDKDDKIKISNDKYYIDLSTFPDSVRFYKFLCENKSLKYNISRKNLEEIYNETCLESPFSNVLFTLSWMNILRVYNNKMIYFLNNSNIYF